MTADQRRANSMFPDLGALKSDPADLVVLGRLMHDPDALEPQAAAHPSNNASVAAGFTYLAQFVAHDLTFAPAASRDSTASAVRAPRLDLDSVYGTDSQRSAAMYEADARNGERARFVIGENTAREHDLPREGTTAVIGDPRNDETVILSQLHLAFLQYHNRVVEELPPTSDLFERAREIVRWHYQWIVLTEVLPCFVADDVLDDVRGGGIRFFDWRSPFMPVEFSLAAFRAGHSMPRTAYTLNATTEWPHMRPLFNANDAGPEPADLRGFRPRPEGLRIEWPRFFLFDGERAPQFARAFDTLLAHSLGRIPHLPPLSPPLADVVPPEAAQSLAVRTLLRGQDVGLPSGQDVAQAMGVPKEKIVGVGLEASKRFSIGPAHNPVRGTTAKRLIETFRTATPLWYYVLKEAELLGEGRLGPVGGRIVAEVIVGLLRADPTSYLSTQPDWRPLPGSFGAAADGRGFGIADLLRHAQVSIAPPLSPR